MASPSGRASMGLLKRGWNEIPEIISSSVLALVGSGIGLFALKYYYDNDLDNRRYRLEYTVIRHDDPRAEKVRKD